MTKGYYTYTVTVSIRVVTKTEGEAINIVRGELASQLNDKRTKTGGWSIAHVSKSEDY